MKKILHNRAKCLLCEEVLESLAKNDRCSCKCGNVTISGGTEETKRIVFNPEKMVELSVFE